MENSGLKQNEIDDLLIRHLIGSISASERSLVNDWLGESADHRKYFDQLKDIYFLGKVLKSPSGFDKQKSLNHVKAQYYKITYDQFAQKASQVIRRRTMYAIVASVAAILLLALSIKPLIIQSDSSFRSVNRYYSEINAPRGSRTNLILPDGTKVWLNAGSKLKYPLDFMSGDREVSLSGEAYFEVSKSTTKRFIVKTNELDIKVWGTKFDVRAYPDEKMIQTTLVEGSVSIQKLNDKKTETYLRPNETAIYYKPVNISLEKAKQKMVSRKNTTNTKLQINEQVKTVLFTSWKDNKWIIEGQTLETFSKELERRYNVVIFFDNESIKNYKFNGILTDETFEQVLKIIKLSAPIDFEITNNLVLLKENSFSKKKYDQYLNHE